jgi:hypothetical protein
MRVCAAQRSTARAHTSHTHTHTHAHRLVKHTPDPPPPPPKHTHTHVCGAVQPENAHRAVGEDEGSCLLVVWLEGPACFFGGVGGVGGGGGVGFLPSGFFLGCGGAGGGGGACFFGGGLEGGASAAARAGRSRGAGAAAHVVGGLHKHTRVHQVHAAGRQHESRGRSVARTRRAACRPEPARGHRERPRAAALLARRAHAGLVLAAPPHGDSATCPRRHHSARAKPRTCMLGTCSVQRMAGGGASRRRQSLRVAGRAVDDTQAALCMRVCVCVLIVAARAAVPPGTPRTHACTRARVAPTHKLRPRTKHAPGGEKLDQHGVCGRQGAQLGLQGGLAEVLGRCVCVGGGGGVRCRRARRQRQ